MKGDSNAAATDLCASYNQRETSLPKGRERERERESDASAKKRESEPANPGKRTFVS